MSEPVRVLIVDDSAAVRAAFSAWLAQDPGPEVVGQAADGVEAVELANRLRPDVITMDVQMPRLDGLGAPSRILHECPARWLGAAPPPTKRGGSLDAGESLGARWNYPQAPGEKTPSPSPPIGEGGSA